MNADLTKKTLKIDCEKFQEKLEKIIADLDLKLVSLEVTDGVDFIISTHTNHQLDAQTRLVLLSSENLPVSQISSNCVAVIDPGLLNHKVGQLYLRRLLGANSSVALEVQFESEGVGFKNFRLIDPDSQGHYSDLIAREITKTNIHPVVPRMFFDGVISYLFDLHEKRKINFPVEVDYGAFKDCFVIQMHCALESLSHSELLAAFKEYDPLNPMRGLLSLISAQVDVLDIYTLESTSKLVMTGVWFNADFKSKSDLHTSLLIHDIEKFQPSSYEFKPGEIDVSAKADQTVESQLIQKIEGLQAQDLERFLVKGSPEDEDKTKTVVSGLSLTDDELSKISGKFEEDESFMRIKGGQEVAPEEVWRFKKAAIVEDIKDKIVVKGKVDPAEIQQIVKDHLGINDELANDVLSISQAETYLKSHQDESNKPWSPQVSSKGQEHEILLRDAQIHKMKKLIDKMKAEILHLREDTLGELHSGGHLHQDKIMEFKDRKIQQLEKRNEELTEEKNSLSIGSTERGTMLELEEENSALHSQIEVLNSRLSQMNENIEAKVKATQEKTQREIEALKRQNKIAHEVMQKFKSEKQKIEIEYKACKEELAQAHEKIIELGRDGSGDNQLQAEMDRLQAFLKDEQTRSRTLESELKGAHVEVKKHEQKTKFLSAQLENLQKQSLNQVQPRATGVKSNSEKPSAREGQLQRLVETMKANEERANAELIGKKDELNKLKSENTLLQNKLNDLTRKLAKFERKAA